jgi:hypothetical protein
MQQVSNCPVCGKQIELIPDPNDPKKVNGYCNHGVTGTIAHAVISQPAEPEQPAEQYKKGVTKHDTSNHPE